MKKLLIASVAVFLTASSFATVAEARGGWRWHNGGRHYHGWNHRGWRGNHYGWHRGWRGGWHRGWRRGWYGGYWGPGVIVVAPGYYGGYGPYYYDDEPRESGR